MLPAVYWHKQMQKTKNTKKRAKYKAAWKSALQAWAAHPFTISASQQYIDEWQEWAISVAGRFHRASSAVEGRNGILSQMYHNRRGLCPACLKALTVIHNYGYRGHHEKTPAEKLFKTSFPNLFEWTIGKMGPLPLPRHGRKRKCVKPLDLQNVAV